MGAQLSLKAAPPFAERIVTALERCCNAGQGRGPGEFDNTWTDPHKRQVIIQAIHDMTLPLMRPIEAEWRTYASVN